MKKLANHVVMRWCWEETSNFKGVGDLVGGTGVGRRRLFWGRDKSSELSSCLCEGVMGVHGISLCYVSLCIMYFRQTQTSRR